GAAACRAARSGRAHAVATTKSAGHPMKLPFKGDTVSKLARTDEDLLATQQQIEAAQQERQSKLLSAGPAEIARLDQSIVDLHRVVGVYNEQKAKLQDRLAVEQEDRREKEYRASVDKIEKSTAGLAGAAQEVEAAIRAVPVAIERFR